MQVNKRWVFSFQYTRRGATTLWDRGRGELREDPPGDAWRGAQVWVGEQSEKLEWVYVAIEKTIDTDDDLEDWRAEALDEAEKSTDAEFRMRHPGAGLV